MLSGILIAAFLSLLDVARRSTTPHTALLVQVPGQPDTLRGAALRSVSVATVAGAQT